MSWFNLDFGDFTVAFLSILFEGVPFLLLGSLISGLVDVFVSSERIAKLVPRNNVLAVFTAGLLGLFLPMCECGSVIVIRRFIRKGLPVGMAVTYMLAAPIVSPIVAFSTFTAFPYDNPWLLVGMRLGMGYAIAVAVGLIISRIPAHRILNPAILPENAANRRAGLHIAGSADGAVPPDFAQIVAAASFPRKLLLAVQSATADFLDVAFYYIIGAGLTSAFNRGIVQSSLETFATSPLLSIIALMVLAALLAQCSTTDAFLAASFPRSFVMESKLAFLVFGPMFDLKLFWLYGLIFRRRVVSLLSVGLFLVVGVLCWRMAALGLWGAPPVVP